MSVEGSPISAMDAAGIRRRFLLLRASRWLPTGLLVPVLVLIKTDRGLTLTQIGLVSLVVGLTTFALELPTGGLADSLGRRPVLVAAGLVDVGSLLLVAVSQTLGGFLAAGALQGIYRALESGPLDAWFVDASYAADPSANVDTGLARGGAVLGSAIAAGSLMSAGLIAWAPVGDALALPVFVAVVLRVGDVVLTRMLIIEVADAAGLAALRSSVQAMPRVIGGAIRTVGSSRVLFALVSVELLWGFGMTAWEMFYPVRLAAIQGSTTAAGALMGPSVTVAWLVSAGAALAVPIAARRFGRALTAVALRILQGCSVAVIGLAGGVVGVVIAFLITNAMHGASNPIHQTLLHRRIDSAERTTVLSVNSMLSMVGFAIGAVGLGAVADRAGLTTAISLAAVVLAAAAVLYLPAVRQETREAATKPGAPAL